MRHLVVHLLKKANVLCKTHNIWGLDLSHRVNHPWPYLQEDKWQQQKRWEENNTEQSNNQAFTGMIKAYIRRINHHPNKVNKKIESMFCRQTRQLYTGHPREINKLFSHHSLVT